MRLDGKVAIVTGGGSGIGEATAKLFAREGAKVAVADWQPEGGREVVRTILRNGGDAFFCEVDVSRADHVQKMVTTTVETYGKLDILVNNAGVDLNQDLLETSEEQWYRCIDINLKGVFLGMKYAIPEMLKNGRGAIVNISSNAGLVGRPKQAVYSAAKGGVVALTRSAAVAYAPRQIRINCICPGSVLTPMLRKVIDRLADPEQALRAMSDVVPLGRLATPEDIAHAVLYLSSDEASYVTGVALAVDGGRTVAIREAQGVF